MGECFLYRLTGVVLDKRLLEFCCCVFVYCAVVHCDSSKVETVFKGLDLST